MGGPRACELLLPPFLPKEESKSLLRAGGEMPPGGGDVGRAEAMDERDGEIAQGGQDLWSVAGA